MTRPPQRPPEAEALARAARAQDARAAGQIVDRLRLRGYRYADLLALVDVGIGEWETLMEEADRLDTESSR